MTTKRILTASITILAIGGMIFMSIPAQAGFFDWFGNTPLNQEASALKASSLKDSTKVGIVVDAKQEQQEVVKPVSPAVNFFTNIFSSKKIESKQNLDTSTSKLNGQAKSSNIDHSAVKSGNPTSTISQMSAITLNTPASQNILAGTQNFVWAELKFSAAGSSENIEITGIQLEATKNNLSANVNGLDNFEIWADLNGALSDSPRGDRYESLVSNTQQWIDTGSLNETRLFTLTQAVTVPINQSVLMAAIGDVSVNAVVGSKYAVSMDNDTGDVVAYGTTSGNTVSVAPVGQGQEMKIIAPPLNSPGLTLAVNSSSPTSDVLLDMGQNGKETLAVFRLSASQLQSLDLDSFKITDDGTDTAIDTYYFQAKSSNGNPLGPEKNVVGGPTAEAHWLDGQVVIPANGYILMEVSGLTKNAEASSLSNGDKVRVTVASVGDVDTTGLTSGTAVDSTQTSVDASIFYVFESYPEFQWLTVSSTTLTNNANHLLGKLRVRAIGNEDVTFQNSDNNNIALRLNNAIGDDTNNSLFSQMTFKNDNGTALDTVMQQDFSGSVMVPFDFGNNDLVIPAGTYEDIYIYMDTSDYEDDNDYLQLYVSPANPNYLDFGVDGQNFQNAVAHILWRADHMVSNYSQMHINPS